MSSNEVAHWQPTELEQAGGGLFESSNPGAVVRKAAEAASELAAVIEAKKLYTMIGTNKHIRIEGWTLLGALLDAFPYVVWSRAIDETESMDGGWEARVEVRTRSGQVIGAAEAECMRSEKRWGMADDYAVRSMAQTRAASKALKQALGFVFAMAGYETTPAEEMPVVDTPRPQPAKAAPDAVEERQTVEIFRLLEELDSLDPATDWPAWCREYAGVPFHKIDKIGADRVIVGLMEKVHDLSPPSEEE